MPKTKRKKSSRHPRVREIGIQFIKLQIAGNIPFWGTYLLFAFFEQVMRIDVVFALLVATILANILFFYVDKRWVFANVRGKRKTTTEIMRFIIFMSFSAAFSFVITWQLHQQLGVTPYIGQFITAAVSTLLTFTGLRFWVFAPPRHHGLLSPRTPTKI